jgi:hypothetical protein
VFDQDGRRLVAGGWQPILAYDVLLANLDRGLRRTPPPETALPLLERFPDGLTTSEVALLAVGSTIVDRESTERHLLELAADDSRHACRSARRDLALGSVEPRRRSRAARRASSDHTHVRRG